MLKNRHVVCTAYTNLRGELLLDSPIFEGGYSTGDRDRRGRCVHALFVYVTIHTPKVCSGESRV